LLRTAVKTAPNPPMRKRGATAAPEWHEETDEASPSGQQTGAFPTSPHRHQILDHA
jgi:hypothetical protein